jgi:hypothetical protein
MSPRLRKQPDPDIVVISRLPIVEALASDAYYRGAGHAGPPWEHVRGSLRKRYIDDVSNNVVSVIADLIRDAVLNDRRDR